MTHIGLLSDTHGYLPDAVFSHFADCDQIWHIGDIGSEEVLEKLRAFKPLHAVYGNIDSGDMHRTLPETDIFTVENVKIVMTHIGGYPGRYAPGIKTLLKKEKPQIFLSGHSHILKVIYDKDLQLLHINPGAAGKQGWHKVQTLVKIDIDGADIKNCRIIELGKK